MAVIHVVNIYIRAPARSNSFQPVRATDVSAFIENINTRRAAAPLITKPEDETES